jgi:hypothetical protein
MTNDKPLKGSDGHHVHAPNPLDIPVRDPLHEIYEGRWKQLPVIQKVGVVVALGFWVVFMVFGIWSEIEGRHLLGLLPLAAVVVILMVFMFALGRSVR